MNGTQEKAIAPGAATFSHRWIDSKGLLLASLIGAVAGTAAFFLLDPLATVPQAFSLPGDLKKAIHLMELFGHGAGVLLVIWLLALVGERRWKQVATAVVLTSIVGAVLKIVFIRQRPSHVEVGEVPGIQLGALAKADPVDLANPLAGLVHDSLHSFPSGHATTAFALATALALLYPRGRVLFFTVAVLVCLQRVFVAAHYFSDVIVGATVGLVLSQVIMDVLEKRRQGASPSSEILEYPQDEVSGDLLPGERRAA